MKYETRFTPLNLQWLRLIGKVVWSYCQLFFSSQNQYGKRDVYEWVVENKYYYTSVETKHESYKKEFHRYIECHFSLNNWKIYYNIFIMDCVDCSLKIIFSDQRFRKKYFDPKRRHTGIKYAFAHLLLPIWVLSWKQNTMYDWSLVYSDDNMYLSFGRQWGTERYKNALAACSSRYRGKNVKYHPSCQVFDWIKCNHLGDIGTTSVYKYFYF